MSDRLGFCVWITGLPSSGKSSITKMLSAKLRECGVPVIVLESDIMRSILTPNPSYTPEERDSFYESLSSIAELITQQGVNVIVDATANRRAYRDHARSRIGDFAEVWVSCPLELCLQRDPKGIYRRAAAGQLNTVPGLQASYEPPANADIVLDCRTTPEGNANTIIDKLHQLLYI